MGIETTRGGDRFQELTRRTRGGVDGGEEKRRWWVVMVMNGGVGRGHEPVVIKW